MTSFTRKQLGGMANASSSSAQQQRQRHRAAPKEEEPRFPILEYTQRVHYIRSVQQANAELAYLLAPTSDGSYSRQLGFDLEWKPTWVSGQPENPVALVQLADEHHVFLVQISAMERRFPEVLLNILDSSFISKGGVGIQGDVCKLFSDWGVSTRSVVDLSLLARSVDNANWKGKFSNSIGLARLFEHYEQRSLPKEKKITRSNWEANLSAKQIEYAASDAVAGYVLLKRLLSLFASMPPTTPPTTPSIWTFNAIANTFYDATPGSGCLWVMENKAYDPGPVPVLTEEEKLAREVKKKEREERRQAARAVRLTAAGTSGELGNAIAQTPGARNQQQWQQRQFFFGSVHDQPSSPGQRRSGQNGYRGSKPAVVDATTAHPQSPVHLGTTPFTNSGHQSTNAGPSSPPRPKNVGRTQSQQQQNEAAPSSARLKPVGRIPSQQNSATPMSSTPHS